MNKEVVLTKETKGIFNNIVEGYKLIEKGTLREYIPIKVEKGSTFKVINFNTSSKRVLVFLHREHSNTKAEIVEINYSDILDYTTINEAPISTVIDAIIISDRIKKVFNKETLNTILVYILITVLSFMLGRL